jgi:hypothetical protein
VGMFGSDAPAKVDSPSMNLPAFTPASKPILGLVGKDRTSRFEPRAVSR